MVESGHTGQASDPRFIIAHELGHAAHTLAALKVGGLKNMPMYGLPNQVFEATINRVMIDAIAATRLPGDTAEVISAINKEMGTRATYPFTEIVAQSFGMYYYGDGEHPIADRVVAYIINLINKE